MYQRCRKQDVSSHNHLRVRERPSGTFPAAIERDPLPHRVLIRCSRAPAGLVSELHGTQGDDHPLRTFSCACPTSADVLTVKPPSIKGVQDIRGLIPCPESGTIWSDPMVLLRCVQKATGQPPTRTGTPLRVPLTFEYCQRTVQGGGSIARLSCMFVPVD